MFNIRAAGVILVALVSTTGLLSSSSWFMEQEPESSAPNAPMDGEAIYKSQARRATTRR